MKKLIKTFLLLALTTGFAMPCWAGMHYFDSEGNPITEEQFESINRQRDKKFALLHDAAVQAQEELEEDTTPEPAGAADSPDAPNASDAATMRPGKRYLNMNNPKAYSSANGGASYSNSSKAERYWEAYQNSGKTVDYVRWQKAQARESSAYKGRRSKNVNYRSATMADYYLKKYRQTQDMNYYLKYRKAKNQAMGY